MPTTWTKIFTYLAHVSPYSPFLTLWEHHTMTSNVQPPELEKLQRLREILDGQNPLVEQAKGTFWTSGAGRLCIAGTLFISQFLLQAICGEEGSLRWYHWFALVNGGGTLVVGILYARFGYQEVLSRKGLEVEWVEKWKKERLAREQNGGVVLEEKEEIAKLVDV